MRRITIALIALVLLLTACGSAESSSRDQLDLEAMEDRDDSAERVVGDDDSTVGDDDSTVGDDESTAAGGRPLTAFEQAFVQGATDEGVPEEAALCILDELESRDTDIVSLATMSEDDVPDDVMAAVFACGDELVDSGTFDFGATGAGGIDVGDGVDDYGDDPTLDALWESCNAGNPSACDDLFWQSPLGSAYEAFGHTCGGTAPAGTDCGQAFGTPAGGTGIGDYGSDPTFDSLYDACAAGDGQACDDLYFSSPIGSEYEAFGDTCGGRYGPGEVLCADEL
jgi:hypothetical protein